jgi:tRNA threonylcarbamoyladenosine biosynthesis protein TsaE
MELTFSLEEIGDAAAKFWSAVHRHKVIALSGNLGAGKTTFIRTICKQLGVRDTVSSPTFAIINEYHFGESQKGGVIYHIDLYRLADENEAVRAGVEDCLLSGSTCFVEWPEKMPYLLPPGTVHAAIEAVGSDRRRLLITDN